MNKKQWVVPALLLFSGLLCSTPADSQEISLRSDNASLQQAFGWAVVKAKSNCMTGKKEKANMTERGHSVGYQDAITCIPSYWAGYRNRTAFYERDFAHQCVGAHLIGLDLENLTMHQAFARHCTSDKKWYSWWALNFDGNVFTLDAPNPPGESPYPGYPKDFKNPKGESFVREVPANFDLLYQAYKCYLWTGDKTYINDPLLKHFYQKVMSDYITLHDEDGNGIPEGKGDIWDGSASYNEGVVSLKEGGDTYSYLYAARLAYAELLEAMGDKAGAMAQRQQADQLRRNFNARWSRAAEGDSTFVCAIATDGTPCRQFMKETTFLMASFGLQYPGRRNDMLLDSIRWHVGEGYGTAHAGPDAMSNIESYTYLPALFFDYNRVADAYTYMKYIIDRFQLPHINASQGANGDYPEVSYTLLSNVVEGMMGVKADAPHARISTISRLPEGTNYVTVSHLKMGNNDFQLTHRCNRFSLLKCTKGSRYTWEAAFYGLHPFLTVNGKKVAAKHRKSFGLDVSYVQTSIQPGKTVEVKL